MIVDAHAHYVPPSIIEELQNGGLRRFPSVKMNVEGEAVRFAFAGNEAKRPIPKGMRDAVAVGSPQSERRVQVA